MSAALVCRKRVGSNNVYYDDQQPSSSMSNKAWRCSASASSPGWFRIRNPSPLDRLSSLFPRMDAQVIERTLEGCGKDIDAAINSLNQLCLGSAEAEQTVPNVMLAASDDPSDHDNLPVDGPEWVELFVKDMMSATSYDDARSRLTRALKAFEEDVRRRADAQVMENSQQVCNRQKIEAVVEENGILKRVFASQHKRQKELEDKNTELEQLLSQYQKQIGILGVKNYELSMHLKLALQGNSIPERFNPDVF